MSKERETTTGLSPQEGKRTGLANLRLLSQEEKLGILHRQWWQMVEESRDPMLLVDADGGAIRDMNSRAEDLLGWSRQDLQGQVLGLVFSRDMRERLKGLVQRAFSHESSSLEEASVQRKNGETLHCHLDGRLVLLHHREGLLLIIRRSTEEHSIGITDRTAAFFRDLSQTLPLLLDFDQILDQILERFALALDFQAFALSLLEEGELKRITLYTAENPQEVFLSEIQERVIEALLHLGVQVIPTRLQYSIRERPWIQRGRGGPIGSELILPIPLGGARGVQGLGGLFHQRSKAFGAEETALFSTFAGGIASSYLVYHSYREIEAQSYTDPLTGLGNRRRLFKELDGLLETADQEGQPFSLIMIDIDHFKYLNDQYGHKVGDEVLRRLAEYLKRGVRETDLVTRYGGEEFLILLPETDPTMAMEIAERIRMEIGRMPIAMPEEMRLESRDDSIRITVSLGVGAVRAGEDPDGVIRRVDDAMYRAKEGGRNRSFLEASSER